MKITNWMAIGAGLMMATSCGSNSTKSETTTDTSVNVSTTPVNTSPVTASIEVPDSIKTSFSREYPTVQEATWSRYQPTDYIDWEWSGWPAMDSSDYAVNFKMDNSDSWAWYDDQNNWVGTVSTVTDYNTLPETVNKKVQSEFAGYTITGVDKERDRKRTAYEIDLMKGEDKARLLIAEDGTVIKKKTITDGVRTKEKM